MVIPKKKAKTRRSGQLNPRPYVSKGLLKAKMLEYFREVERTGKELIVTDNQIPVLRILPIKTKRKVNDVFADLRGKLQYKGELTEPSTEEWEDV
jgi:antitoxin (DNA-binding transcriptional repressor) of toxin-antitoxin stability system